MPSIDGGGAEKNLFIIANFLSQKFKKVSIITSSTNFKKKFINNIEFISPKSFIWDKFGRKIKTLISILILIKIFFKKENNLVLSF